MKEITGVLVNPEEGTALIESVPDNLADWYRVLDCSTIDIVTKKIGLRYFEIVCDDNGRLRDHPRASALNKRGKPVLVGRLFVCSSNLDGELTSLDAKELAYVMEHVRYITTDSRPFRSPVLAPVWDFWSDADTEEE